MTLSTLRPNVRTVEEARKTLQRLKTGVFDGLGTMAQQDSDDVDISGGEIDGTVIGANEAAAGTFTTGTIGTADINGGAIDATTVGVTTPAVGTFTIVTAKSSEPEVRLIETDVADKNLSMRMQGGVCTIYECNDAFSSYGSRFYFDFTNDLSGALGDFTVGPGYANGTLKTYGNYDIIIQTGNETTGYIQITDGSNGNITIATDGTGEVDITRGDIAGVKFALASKTTTYTLTINDDVILCGAGNETFTVDLPVVNSGKHYWIKNVGTGTITVDADGTASTTIDGNTTATLSQYEAIHLVADSSEYWII